LSWLRIVFCNLFWFVFYKFVAILWLGCGFNKLIQYIIVSVFKKKYYINFFKINYAFIKCLGYFKIYQIYGLILVNPLNNLIIFFTLKKMNPFQSAVNDLVLSQMKILVSPCDFDFSNYQVQIAFLLSGAKPYKINKEIFIRSRVHSVRAKQRKTFRSCRRAGFSCFVIRSCLLDYLVCLQRAREISIKKKKKKKPHIFP
jgi:hypothetical protein